MMGIFRYPVSLLVVWSAAFAGAAEIYVAPHGQDSNSGTKEKPFATIAHARDAARDARGEPVTVYLDGGTYYLSEPLVFSAVDSRTADTPLLFTALPGQSPVISGGQQLALSWRPYRDGIVRADVPSELNFDQLFVNGERQHMARWPDYDATAQYFQGFSADSTSPQRVALGPSSRRLHPCHAQEPMGRYALDNQKQVRKWRIGIDRRLAEQPPNGSAS